MSLAGTVDSPVEIFSGLVTNITPTDLPHGVSPDCQDCSFVIGAVQTRPGLTSKYTLNGNPTYLKTYENLLEIPRFLMLDSTGVLWTDTTPGGPLAQITSDLLGSSAKSTTLFGREYIAFNDTQNGADLPRQYDDTNFDRVSQVGPGAGPSVTDETASYPIGVGDALSVAPVTVGTGSQSGYVCTILAAVAFSGDLQVGDTILVSGMPVGGYNGTQVISALPPLTAGVYQSLSYVLPVTGLAPSLGGGTVDQGLVTFIIGSAPFVVGQLVTTSGMSVTQYNTTFAVREVFGGSSVNGQIGQFGLAPSGPGTIFAAGNIPVGVHKVSVIFVTRTDYFTAPSPSTSWNAGGGKRAIVANIPIGPANVIARILCFTAAAGASFFYVGPTGVTLFSGNMYIADNTTTSAIVDFSDEILLGGTNVDDLFKLIELPQCAGVIDYAERLFWWGEKNSVKNFVNLTFDGGAGSQASATSYPLGWTPMYVNPGEAVVTAVGIGGWGEGFAVIGSASTGPAVPYGMIQQGAYADSDGVPIIKPNTAYSVRARFSAPGGTTFGTATIELYSPSLGSRGKFTVAANSMRPIGILREYTGTLMAAQTVIPTDLVLRYYVQGTLTSGKSVTVDCIELFPTNEPYNNSIIRASKAEDEESYDGIDGEMTISENNGQAVRTMFKLRESLYVVKEHSMFVTSDDNTNEPALWPVTSVSQKVGTPSINGVAVGEDWVIIAHRTGLYIFTGGEPAKISEEIQPTWDQINWAAGSTLWVTVDTRKRRIYVGAPMGVATQPNEILVMDYHDVGGASEIESSPPIRLSYTGAKRAFDKSRKWCPWTISANCGALIEQQDGTAQVFFGSNIGDNNVNLLDDTALGDNGAAIPSYYTTAYFVEQINEQQLQLRSHRKLFSYLTMYIEGSGTLSLIAFPNTLSAPRPCAGLLLHTPASQDTEIPLNLTAERAAFQVGTSAVGSWFKLQKMVPCVQPEPWAPVRGMN